MRRKSIHLAIIIFILISIVLFVFVNWNNKPVLFISVTATPTGTFTLIPTLALAATDVPATATPAPTPAPTSTLPSEQIFLLLPCNPETKEFTSELESIAEEWFTSADAPMLEREEYQDVTAWHRFCEIHTPDQNTYLAASWVNAPIEIAMKIVGYPNIDGVPPFSVNVFYFNKGFKVTTKIVSVTVLSKNGMDDSVRDKETRIDLVEIDGVWQVHWVGSRYRCYRNNSDEWVTSFCP